MMECGVMGRDQRGKEKRHTSALESTPKDASVAFLPSNVFPLKDNF